jgi:carboxyl-terminal processing protease
MTVLSCRRVLLAFIAIGIAFSSVFAAEEATKDQKTAAFKLHLARMRRANLTTVWNVQMKVEDLGPDVLDEVRAALDSKEVHVRLAMAKVLYTLDAPAPEALAAILAGDDLPAAVAAAHLMGSFGEDEEEEALRSMMTRPVAPRLKVACAAALWDITGGKEWKGLLQNILTSGDRLVVRRAALELARMGDLPLVKGFLQNAGQDPSLEGRVAQAVLDAEEIRSAQSEISIRKIDLVEEVITRVMRSYIDAKVKRNEEEKPLDHAFLIDQAAMGITSSLDRFCSYMTKKQYDDDRRRATGSYAGIGAYVRLVDFDLEGHGKKVKVLKIDRPIYTPPAPAYNSGLRSGDMILHVYEGKEWTTLIDATLPESIKKLKGPVGTSVRIRVKRRGREELLELRITRALITINVAVPDMLPGGIGYIYLKRFDNKASKDLERALTKLEGRGMKGLLLDLRGNPGGSLIEVVECCRKFLNNNSIRLVTYTRGRTDDWTRYYRTSKGKAHPPFPMAVLIDSDSASGSEMLSGALKAYGRAVILGETSFGKGSGQTIFPLVSSRGKDRLPQRYLRMTIFKYYLPDKTSIHGRGVQPDILVPYEKISAFQYFWQENLIRDEAITRYLDGVFKPKTISLWEKLARFDGFDTKAYPGFGAFYKSLDTKLDSNYVRRMVRQEVKERLQDERGRAYLRDDFQEDSQVQRAILVLLKKLGLDPRSIPSYRHFAKKFD